MSRQEAKNVILANYQIKTDKEKAELELFCEAVELRLKQLPVEFNDTQCKRSWETWRTERNLV